MMVRLLVLAALGPRACAAAVAPRMSASGRPLVLCLDSPKIAQLLEDTGDIDVAARSDMSNSDVIDFLAAQPAEGIILRSANQCDARMMDASPRLTVVGRAGIGVDNIDLSAAEERSISIFNTPLASVQSVAELTLALMLAAARRVTLANASLREGRWDRALFEGHTLEGKILGVIGFGPIGEATAALASAFGMRVCTLQSSLRQEAAASCGYELVSMDNLLSRAHYVSLHVPLTPGTRGLIGAHELAQMQKHATLVNTARGGLVDEEALLGALDAGEIGAACLDVFAQEGAPLSDTTARLCSHERVITTPHLGGSTAEARKAISTELALKVHGHLTGSGPPSYTLDD